MADPLRAAAGFGAGACAVGGTVAVTVAVVAGPGPGLTGYVSEAGVESSGYASTYRIGIFVLAAGLLLFALALPWTARGPADRGPARPGRATSGPVHGGPVVRVGGVVLPDLVRTAAALLATSAACTVLSGAVTCSAGCPLPPFEPATTADLVHGAASIAAVASCVFAMVALAWSPTTPRALRRLSVVAAAVALPLSAAVGIAMLVLGRGPVVALVERVLLLEAAVWVLLGGVLVGSGRARARTQEVRNYVGT
ncbi:DUF998 domain-containing protein [Polymorphospora rubra]